MTPTELPNWDGTIVWFAGMQIEYSALDELIEFVSECTTADEIANLEEVQD